MGPAKRAANIAKHGIDFVAASRVFEDVRLLVEPDPRDYGTEMRHRAVGLLGDRVITECFTMRGDTCRIISARRANRRERNAYSV